MKHKALLVAVLSILAAVALVGTRRVFSREPLAIAPSSPSGLADRKPKAYLASPFGFSEAGKSFYNGTLVALVKDSGFETLDPWTLTPANLIDPILSLHSLDARRAAWMKVNPIIGQNNAAAIRRCDVVVAGLDGSDVDSGTASEIGYAAALGKIIIGYRSDFRQAGDNEGAVVNLQVEYFIRQSGGDIYGSALLLGQALKKLRGRLPASGGRGRG